MKNLASTFCTKKGLKGQPTATPNWNANGRSSQTLMSWLKKEIGEYRGIFFTLGSTHWPEIKLCFLYGQIVKGILKLG